MEDENKKVIIPVSEGLVDEYKAVFKQWHDMRRKMWACEDVKEYRFLKKEVNRLYEEMNRIGGLILYFGFGFGDES